MKKTTETKAFIAQQRFNLLDHSIKEAEKQLDNARRVVKLLTKDIIILKGMRKDEDRKRK